MTVGRDTRCDISERSAPLAAPRGVRLPPRRARRSRSEQPQRHLGQRREGAGGGAPSWRCRQDRPPRHDLSRRPRSARAAPPRPAADTGRPGAGDDPVEHLDAARTEKIEPSGGGRAAPGANPRDDRTEVVPRRSALAPRPRRSRGCTDDAARPRLPRPRVCRRLHGCLRRNSRKPTRLDSADDPRHRGKTATPVLPLSALRRRGRFGAAASASCAGRRRPSRPSRGARLPPPVAVAPPVTAPPPRIRARIGRWNSGRRTPDRPSPPPERLRAPPYRQEPPHPGSHHSSSSGVRALAGSLLLALVAFALGAVPLLVWRGRIPIRRPHADRPHRAHRRNGDRRVRPAAARGAGRGPPVAWWLRRG